MRLIKLSSADYKKCEDFANNVDTSFYANRKQFNDDKRKKDSIIGKIGEIVTYNTLVKNYPELTYPDFEIYSAKQKSWQHDLMATNLNLHVKSQDVNQGKKYGESWVFQKEDKHIFKEYTDHDYVSFVSVDLKTRDCFVRAILPISMLHEQNLFKPMKLLHLASKVAVYYEDIKDLKSHLV